MGRLFGLDALRGIAALLVAAGHAEYLSGTRDGVLSSTFLAVDFFFLLSGYILARTYEGRLGNELSALNFTHRRIKRLWPIVAIGAALGFVAFTPYFGAEFAAILFAMSLAMIPLFIAPHASFPINPPTWSLVFELVANVIHGLLLHRLPVRWLLAISAICAGSLFVTAGEINSGFEPRNWGFGFFRIGMTYPLGIVLWRLAGDRARSPVWPAIVALTGAILLAPYLGHWFEFVFALIVCPAILLCGLGAGRFPGFAALGTLSYPLYAVHYPVQRGLIYEMDLGPLPAFLASLAVAALVAWLLERRRQMHSIANQPPVVVIEPVLTRACNSK